MKLTLLILVISLFSSCSSLVLVKDCNKVEGSDKNLSACRVVKPWE